jgi:ATP-dependent phosphofructokinase / diphosphate-dependent phosphofructokinase
MAKKRVGILTGGGDCPGLNAVIRGVTKSAIHTYDMEVVGFYDGFQGLIEERFDFLTVESASGILTQGGTILGSSNKANPFQHAVMDGQGVKKVDVSDQCIRLYGDLGLEALICVGGDGTMTIAGGLAAKGARIVGLPKTIDKDLMETDVTFGFDTARSIATEATDRLHTTAQSHHRVMLVEVMGRNAGWLAVEAGLAGGADIILIPELPYDIEQVIQAVLRRNLIGKRFSIVVVAEGARAIGGTPAVQRVVTDSPDPIRLGGISHSIAHQIEAATGIESRVAILGHVQRGGIPTAADRLLGTQLAVKAMEMVRMGEFNQMAAMQGNQMVAVPLEKVAGKQRLVPQGSPLIQTAAAIGVSFGVAPSGWGAGCPTDGMKMI